MWWQRSKITWLKYGDKNTRYFHNKALIRKKKNYIGRIRDHAGIWYVIENWDCVIVDYFTQLFSFSVQGYDFSFLEYISNRVDERMHRILDADFIQQEVVSTLKHMHPTKTPRSDEMSPIFNQKH